MASISLFRFLFVCTLSAFSSSTTSRASIDVQLFTKFEVCVEWSKQYNNPFNYSEVAVQAEITAPDKTVIVDGFYYQNFTRSLVNGQEKIQTVGSPLWCIRFSPTVMGLHSISVTVTDSMGKYLLENTSFQAVSKSSNAQGFVRIGKNNVHFQFDSGKTYFPIGENVCWVSYSQGTYAYDDYMTSLSGHGANYIRLWLTDVQWDGLAVEIAVGKYNLGDLWRLDYVVSLAEKLDICLLMCTESFNLLTTKTSANLWYQSYYNKKNGGILDYPQEFFTNEQAKMDYKNRLRYLIARYGYSTSVFAWEYFNEVDITDNYNSTAQVLWTEEMTDWVHSYDINRHLISTSFSNSDGDSNVQGLTSLDFTMTHNYNEPDIATTTAMFPAKKLSQYHKPSYVAEFGVPDQGAVDKEGFSLHNGLWAAAVQLAAGTCMTWWWDSWVAPNNLYGTFDGISQFVKKMGSIGDYQWHLLTNSTVSIQTVRVFGMYGYEGTSNMGLVALWIQDSCSTWSQQHAGAKCTLKSNVATSITLPGCVGMHGNTKDYLEGVFC
jgi:hypothetical protein